MKRCFLVAQHDMDLPRLRARIEPGDIVLPLYLDALAEGETLENIQPLETFIDSRKRAEIELQAHELAKHIALNICGGRLLDGLNWAEICRDDASLIYSRDLVLAFELSKRLARQQFDEIVYSGPEDYPLYRAPNAVLSTLRAELGARLVVQKPPQVRTDSRKAWWQDKLSAGWQYIREYLPKPHQSQMCTVASVFATTEWERFTQPLLSLQDEYGKEYQFWYLGDPPSRLVQWSRQYGVLLASVPYPEHLDPDLSSFFAECWEYWMAKGRYQVTALSGCGAIARDQLVPHFRQRITYTMARAAQWGRELAVRIQDASPQLLVGSSACTYMTVFPYHVANRSRITSLALPVTYVSGSPSHVPSSFLACKDIFQRENQRRFFPDDNRILYCRDASNSVTYVPAKLDSVPETAERIVVILSSFPTMEYDSVLPMVDSVRYLETLRSMAVPPTELSDLTFVFKSHPRFDSALLYKKLIVKPNSNFHILPGNASLTELLRRAWAVVVADHYGSVVAEAIASGRPLVFLDSAEFHAPYLSTMAYEAGTVIHDVPRLWEFMGYMYQDPKLYSTWEERCQRFRTRYFGTIESTVIQQIRKIIGKPQFADD